MLSIFPENVLWSYRHFIKKSGKDHEDFKKINLANEDSKKSSNQLLKILKNGEAWFPGFSRIRYPVLYDRNGTYWSTILTRSP